MKKLILIYCFLFCLFTFNKGAAQVNFKWAKSLMGSQNTIVGSCIAFDAAGNVYITGLFNDTIDFDPGSGTVKLKSNGLSDIFFAKYDAHGNYKWAKHMGAATLTGYAGGTGIAIDRTGNICLTGFFNDTVVFGSGTSTTTLYSNGQADIFAAKYKPNGDLIWAKKAGGIGDDGGAGIAVDSARNIYLTGGFEDTVTFGSGVTVHSQGSKDIFWAKYDSTGTCIWAQRYGDSSEDKGLSTAVDGSGNAYLAGTYQGDIFFAKYNTSSGGVVWTKQMGAEGSDAGNSVAVDGSGNVYLTGTFGDSANFNPGGTPNILHSSSSGLRDIFFAKYDITGNNVWAKRKGDTDTASGNSIAVDGLGNIYLTGYFYGTVSFDPNTNLGDLTSPGNIFFAKYTSAGNYVWAKNVGACSDDKGISIAVDHIGNVYTLGEYNAPSDFDPGAGTAILNDDQYMMGTYFEKYAQGTSTITGSVRYSGGSINSGYVKLYPYANHIAMHLADSVVIDNSGHYTFSNVCSDSSIVFAVADTSVAAYHLAAPTYADSATHWDSARIIAPLPNTTVTANIKLKEYLPPTGETTISGAVLEGDSYVMGGMTVFEGDPYIREPGKPIDGTDVGLDHEPGTIAIHTTTGTDGTFTFNHVPLGTYNIYVNIPGLPMVSTYHLHVTAPVTINNLVFLADSNSIYTDSVRFTSVKAIASPSEIKMQVYPNPYNGFTNIEFMLAEANTIQLGVYNLFGEKVFELLNEKKQAGIIKYRFNASNAGLKAGVYLLRLNIGGEIITKKIIQIQ